MYVCVCVCVVPKGVFVSGQAVKPAGSTWARNPVPRTATDNRGMSEENCKYRPSPPVE